MNDYQIAAQLFISNMRALEQRSTAFLFAQSILVGGFVVMLYGLAEGKTILRVPIAGIVLLGIVLSVLFYVAGKCVSKDAFILRDYIRHIESTIGHGKEGVYTYYDKFCQQHRWDKQKKLNKRLPGPTLWLIIPTIFLLAWIIAAFWIASEVCSSFSIS